MKNVSALSLLSLMLAVPSFAQSIDDAKKAIDAEQFDKAKKILKNLVQTQQDKGENYYYLGELYLTQEIKDSALMTFEKGINAKDKGHLNYIGLGAIDLHDNKTAQAVANFDIASKQIKKKESDDALLIAKAYIHSENANYNKAIELINSVLKNDPKSAQAYYLLGEANEKLKKHSEAYSGYNQAFNMDNSKLRAKLNLARMTKHSRAFQEAISMFNQILATNPSYGPAHRELAETYYLWGVTDQANFNKHVATALTHYKKYMDLTDYSLDSRMRLADFLILAKDYKGLEKEALSMRNEAKVNARIHRYLGYASYENGKYDEAIASLNEFFAKADAKRIIPQDHYFVGKALLAKAKKVDGTYDAGLLDQAVVSFKKAVEMDGAMANEFNDIGIELYKSKDYNTAAKIFEIGTSNPKSANYLYDNFYLGYALYFGYEVGVSPVTQLERASHAFDEVIKQSSTTQDAHLFKARVNDLIGTTESKEVALQSYKNYYDVINSKTEADKLKAKSSVKEALTYVGAHYANTDQKELAVEFLQKLLAEDPGNDYATKTLKAL